MRLKRVALSSCARAIWLAVIFGRSLSLALTAPLFPCEGSAQNRANLYAKPDQGLQRPPQAGFFQGVVAALGS